MPNFIKEISAGITPSNSAIWDELSEEYQHQSTTKSTILNAQSTVFLCN